LPTRLQSRCAITTSNIGLSAEYIMITKITGVLQRVLDEEIRLQVGPLEYQVLVPEFVRRTLQTRLGEEVSLHTSHYLDGNPAHGRMVPRLIGFANEAELEFFELFCTIDKVGVRKAIKALVRPIRDIADAIHRQDAKWLTSLPGIGPSTAEQAVATLRRKVTKFALMPTPTAQTPGTAPTVEGNVLEDAYQALVSVGHSPQEARERLDRLLAGGKQYKNVEDILLEIYKHHS
jgi:holliday junction DNA helicase RuvA